MDNQELFAMKCAICGYVTTLTEAEYQRFKHCGKCGNEFDSGRWKSIYKTVEKESKL